MKEKKGKKENKRKRERERERERERKNPSKFAYLKVFRGNVKRCLGRP